MDCVSSIFHPNAHFDTWCVQLRLSLVEALPKIISMHSSLSPKGFLATELFFCGGSCVDDASPIPSWCTPLLFCAPIMYSCAIEGDGLSMCLASGPFRSEGGEGVGGGDGTEDAPVPSVLVFPDCKTIARSIRAGALLKWFDQPARQANSLYYE